MTTLTEIAANYKRAACLVTGDGREWWRVEADRQVWLFMVEAARLADTQRTVVEPCFKVGPTFGFNYADIGGAEEHNDEGMVRNDDWLAECEREWGDASMAALLTSAKSNWATQYGKRLIAAAKERVDLRAQVEALTKERDEARRKYDDANVPEAYARIKELMNQRNQAWARIDALRTKG